MVKYKYIILISFILILFASCKKDNEYIVADKTEMPFLIFNEEIVFSPINTEKGFVFVSKKSNKHIFSCIDEDGNRVWKTNMDSIPLITKESKISNSTITELDDGFFITFTHIDTTVMSNEYRMEHHFCAIKTDLQGETLWKIYDTIPYISPDNLKNIFCKSDNEIALILETQDEEYNQIFKIFIYNNKGNNVSENSFSLEADYGYGYFEDVPDYDDNGFIFFTIQNNGFLFSKIDYSGNITNNTMFNHEFEYNPDDLSYFERTNKNIVFQYFGYVDDNTSNLIFLEYNPNGSFVKKHKNILIDKYYSLDYEILNNNSNIFIGGLQTFKTGISKPKLAIFEYNDSSFIEIDNFKTNEASVGLCIRKRKDDGYTIIGEKINFGLRNTILIKTDENGLINQE